MNPDSIRIEVLVWTHLKYITTRCFLVAQVRCGVRVLKVWYGCVVNDSSSALGKEVSNA